MELARSSSHASVGLKSASQYRSQLDAMHAELEAMRVQLTEAHTSLEAAQAEVASVKRDAAAKAEANAALLHRVRHEIEAPSSNKCPCAAAHV